MKEVLGARVLFPLTISASRIANVLPLFLADREGGIAVLGNEQMVSGLPELLLIRIVALGVITTEIMRKIAASQVLGDTVSFLLDSR